MDSLITAAGRALAAGDPLGALKRVALRDDPPALALRGIAMAQLGDLPRATHLLRRAARAFGPRESVAQARCVVAEAEIALVSRDLAWPSARLDAARLALAASGDPLNAAHATILAARRQLLVGRLDEAEGMLQDLDPTSLPPALRATYDLAIAGIAIRRLATLPASEALARAGEAASQSAIPSLIAEVRSVAALLTTPAARRIGGEGEALLRLDEVEALFASDALVVDACRNWVRHLSRTVILSTRPVLFALARALAEAWPGDVSRQVLIAKTFRARQVDESHRARLRVEIGRLRAELKPVADVEATARGFTLIPRASSDVVILTPPVEVAHADVLALLADGEAWSTSALAIALDASPRTIQRALEALAAAGNAHPIGRGRARRWLTQPEAGFPTTLLLPGPPPG